MTNPPAPPDGPDISDMKARIFAALKSPSSYEAMCDVIRLFDYVDKLESRLSASLGREQALTAERDFAMRPDVTWEYMHYPSGFMWKVRWRSEFQHIEAEGVSKAEAVRKALQEMERRAASSPSPKTP